MCCDVYDKRWKVVVQGTRCGSPPAPLFGPQGRVTAHARGSRLLQFSVSPPCTFDIALTISTFNFSIKMLPGCVWPSLQAPCFLPFQALAKMNFEMVVKHCRGVAKADSMQLTGS